MPLSLSRFLEQPRISLRSAWISGLSKALPQNPIWNRGDDNVIFVCLHEITQQGRNCDCSVQTGPRETNHRHVHLLFYRFCIYFCMFANNQLADVNMTRIAWSVKQYFLKIGSLSTMSVTKHINGIKLSHGEKFTLKISQLFHESSQFHENIHFLSFSKSILSIDSSPCKSVNYFLLITW